MFFLMSSILTWARNIDLLFKPLETSAKVKHLHPDGETTPHLSQNSDGEKVLLVMTNILQQIFLRFALLRRALFSTI